MGRRKKRRRKKKEERIEHDDFDDYEDWWYVNEWRELEKLSDDKIMIPKIKDEEYVIETDLCVYNKCPNVPNEVFISPKVLSAIITLLNKYPKYEWELIVYGEDNIIKDYYLPEQEVTRTGVEIKGDYPSEINGYKILGTVHSHNSMSVFHSHTDDDHHNFKFSIVVNNKLEFYCVAKVKAVCGEYVKSECKVSLLADEDIPFDRIRVRRIVYNIRYGKRGYIR